MKTIYFKNGTTQEINEEVFEDLCENIREGAGVFQLFKDEEGVCYLVINLIEITHIL